MTNSKSLFYWDRVHNFGDMLNKDFFKKVFAYEFSSLSNPFYADCMAIGSLFQCFYKQQNVNIPQLPPIKVLGTGIWTPPPDNIAFIRDFDIKALRGNLTKKWFLDKGLCSSNITVGDLGLLAPKYLQKNIEKKFELGILPHYKDLQSPIFFEIYKNNPNSIIINPLNNPEVVIEQIASCETIVSSSLHGLIVADSFNIPNLWLENDLKADMEPRFKYMDYYSIYSNFEEFAPIRALDFLNKDINFIKANYKIAFSEVKSIQDTLFNSFSRILTDL